MSGCCENIKETWKGIRCFRWVFLTILLCGLGLITYGLTAESIYKTNFLSKKCADLKCYKRYRYDSDYDDNTCQYIEIFTCIALNYTQVYCNQCPPNFNCAKMSKKECQNYTNDLDNYLFWGGFGITCFALAFFFALCLLGSCDDGIQWRNSYSGGSYGSSRGNITVEERDVSVQEYLIIPIKRR